jgi:hypothetical protein
MGWEGNNVFQVLIVQGSTGSGIFVYSPAPALGNLIASVAAAAGTDPYGNGYVQGIAAYFGGTPAFALGLTGFTLQWYNAAGPAGPYGANGPSLAVDGTGKLLNIIPGSLGSVNVPLGLFNAKQGATVVGGLTADIAPITAGETVSGGLVVNASGADLVALSNTLASGQILQVTNLGSSSGPIVRVTANAINDIMYGGIVAGDTNARIAIDTDASGFPRIRFGSGAAAPDAFLLRTAAHLLAVNNADLDINTVGRGLQIKEGSNARMGQATLVAGSVTVNNTTVTGSTRIFLSCASRGGTQGFLDISTVTVGTSFTIRSSNGADTSVINWLLIEPG